MGEKPSYAELEQRVAALTDSLGQCQSLLAAVEGSEELGKSLIEQVNIGIYRHTAGAGGVFLQANQAMAEMFGYSSLAEFLRVPVVNLYRHPGEWRQFVAEVARTGFVKEREVGLQRRDGAPFWAAGTAKGRVDAQGRLLWVEGVLVDISERKEAEETIARSYYYESTLNAVLQVALENIPLEEQVARIMELLMAIPFLSMQVQGCISLHGMAAGQVGEGLSELVRAVKASQSKVEILDHPPPGASLPAGGEMAESRPRGLAAASPCTIPISAGERQHGTINITLREGQTRSGQEDKFLAAIAHTLAGIIEHKHTEYERRRLHEQLLQAEKLSALGRMTANIAHEIRNPLTVLGGLAKRLDKRMAAGSKEKEYAEVMVAEVSRLEKILTGILCFSKDTCLVRRFCLLDGIVTEALHVLAVLCEEREIAVETALTPMPPLFIDPDRVREVIDNLLYNAIEAIPGAGQITIRTGSDQLANTLYRTVRISDTGIGMSAEAVARIFEPFFTTKAVGNGQGVGLGLAICKKIMDEHRGTIRVESRPGAGATFVLYFPVEPEPAAG